MIQRIQSVFLLLLALAMLATAALPLWTKTDPLTNGSLTLTAFNLYRGPSAAAGEVVASAWPIGALAITAAATALYAIFQYRRRSVQLLVCSLNLLLVVATLGAAFLYSSRADAMLNVKMEGHYLAGFYLPTLALVLNLLASRYIRQDERLVRSMDRLR
ncbi:DUF4293 family protein [Hymenobacter coccineus]|uniref:DUF4293 domain-containing protein n=1 Tax=Hymenobacter coccineus TaxID=1908235 RepID=A0A1G1T1X0_9BACT|nr:DUF4293 family protein [Hymenobacter coccineus]OGX84836.1 hypothetical protein BEN49_01700 [Hymenobacter coccineus]